MNVCMHNERERGRERIENGMEGKQSQSKEKYTALWQIAMSGHKLLQNEMGIYVFKLVEWLDYGTKVLIKTGLFATWVQLHFVYFTGFEFIFDKK